MFQRLSRFALTVGLAAAMTLPAAADELAKIKESGSFSAAMSGQYPPFSFVNEANEVIGFDVDITNEIAKRLGVEGKVVTAKALGGQI